MEIAIAVINVILPHNLFPSKIMMFTLQANSSFETKWFWVLFSLQNNNLIWVGCNKRPGHVDLPTCKGAADKNIFCKECNKSWCCWVQGPNPCILCGGIHRQNISHQQGSAHELFSKNSNEYTVEGQGLRIFCPAIMNITVIRTL